MLSDYTAIVYINGHERQVLDLLVIFTNTQHPQVSWTEDNRTGSGRLIGVKHYDAKMRFYLIDDEAYHDYRKGYDDAHNETQKG